MSKKRCPRFSRMALLDLRAWVAAMFFVFGAMLAVYGLYFADAEDLAKAAGTNLDLWTGVGMIAFAAFFAVWLIALPPEIEFVADAEGPADAEHLADDVDGAAKGVAGAAAPEAEEAAGAAGTKEKKAADANEAEDAKSQGS